jgi:hypothetical protein
MIIDTEKVGRPLVITILMMAIIEAQKSRLGFSKACNQIIDERSIPIHRPASRSVGILEVHGWQSFTQS